MPAGPDVWGPHGWKFLHFVTLGYPNSPSNEVKNIYKDFFTNFSKVIPCPLCANHFQEHLEIYPLDDEVLSSKINLINWGIDMHNEVNKINGKKIYTYEEGLKNILDGSKPIKCLTNNTDDFSNDLVDNFTNITKNNDYIYIIVIIILSIIILFLLYSKYK